MTDATGKRYKSGQAARKAGAEIRRNRKLWKEENFKEAEKWRRLNVCYVVFCHGRLTNDDSVLI